MNPPPLSEVQPWINAINNGDLAKLSELLDDKNVNITKLYSWDGIDISILGYAVVYTNNTKARAEVVALLIEKKNPDLTLPAEYSYDNLLQQMQQNLDKKVFHKMFRIVYIAHIVNGITISDWVTYWNTFSLDWPLVQLCYNRLKSDTTARVMDFDWYKRQTFKRPDEEGKLKYSKECHLAWAIAYLLLHYGGMKNLTKWGISLAVTLMDESRQVGIERALRRTPPRFALKY
jgi:hypothetical protein